ncbi:UDP-N-acetylmuramoyl-tripeptide--D-alanyl-D-alanine ligase [Carnimonas nigrificans]|uniref:UDP-N-acetylmuramoyl-tripeptide--D-alanyl-D- alanine ligase n=1 Tax=Carnimonas nigrificans TaxID=64323 RepID=UPI0004B88141|nr:UDP-N-acetylmuramoyl-tripeptide--D-alanyl-D-alanine ligase [Carnimonas nigrificans]
MITSLKAAADAMGAQFEGTDQPFVAPRTDSRAVAQGDLFFAMRGEAMDGHLFVATALEAGAAAVVVDHDISVQVPAAIGRQLVVKDTRLALGLLGGSVRQQWGGSLSAVTGNSGKTTVKEMIKAILEEASSEEQVVATHGNLNSYVGVPLTLCRLQAQHQWGVVELGANHVGEISWTAPLVQPQVAVITNVTGAHMGEFGGLARIAQAKAEILSGLAEGGIAVLNRDDTFYPLWRRLAILRGGEECIRDFGISSAAYAHPRNVGHDAHGRYHFELQLGDADAGTVSLALLGEHNVRNALAAAAATSALGVAPNVIVRGLERVASVGGRMALRRGKCARTLLDDTYNANPGAFRAALETLALQPGPRWCLLGAMGELGEQSAAQHAAIGHYAKALGIDGLIAYGESATAAAHAFGGECFDDWEAFLAAADEKLPANASVLIKGSRSTLMERAVEHFAE